MSLIAAWLVAMIIGFRGAAGRTRTALRATLWLAGGAVLAQLTYLIPVLVQGTLREFWQAVVMYNFGPYAGIGLSSSRFLIVSVLIGKETLGLWLLALVAFVYMLWRDRQLGNWLIVGWGVLAGGMLVLQDRFFSYQYMPLLPPLSLLAAYGVVQWWRQAGGWRAKPATWIARVLLALVLLANAAQFARTNAQTYSRFVSVASGRMDSETFYDAFNTYPRHYSFPADKAVADWVRQRTGPEDHLATMGGYGATPVYLSGRLPASRYVFTYHLFHKSIVDHPMVEAMREQFLVDLEASRPSYVLLFRDLEEFERFGSLHAWLTTNYQLEREFKHGRTLYRRTSP
jgi:hypothetical protein